MHNTPKFFLADLVYVLAPRRGPDQTGHEPVPHGLLHLLVRSVASIVSVKGGEHVVRVQLINESNL